MRVVAMKGGSRFLLRNCLDYWSSCEIPRNTMRESGGIIPQPPDMRGRISSEDRLMRSQLTRQEEEFVRLVVVDGCSFVGAYRVAYPARKRERSAEGERVAAKGVAHRPLVEKRMKEL